jgi:hypothetical protein
MAPIHWIRGFASEQHCEPKKITVSVLFTCTQRPGQNIFRRLLGEGTQRTNSYRVSPTIVAYTRLLGPYSIEMLVAKRLRLTVVRCYY